MIRVFIEGSDGGMWALSPLTWDHIAVGNRETSGMWIRASDAVKLFQSGVAIGAATSATDWCGSEGGTPRPGFGEDPPEIETDFERSESGTTHARVTFDTAASERAHEGNPLPCGMARNVIESRPDNGEDAAADQQLAAELSAADAAEREDEEALDAYLAAPDDESDFERRERIASEVGDRKLDQQRDGEA